MYKMLSGYENEQVLLLEMRADAGFDPGNGTSFYSIKNAILLFQSCRLSASQLFYFKKTGK
jgi:hypothetical protein